MGLSGTGSSGISSGVERGREVSAVETVETVVVVVPSGAIFWVTTILLDMMLLHLTLVHSYLNFNEVAGRSEGETPQLR